MSLIHGWFLSWPGMLENRVANSECENGVEGAGIASRHSCWMLGERLETLMLGVK
jgi:hypothetical protein